MAVCLNCGSRHARVLWSRSAVVIEEGPDEVIVERVCRRTTLCPTAPAGCGQRRYQRITDEGKAVNARPDESEWEFRARR